MRSRFFFLTTLMRMEEGLMLPPIILTIQNDHRILWRPVGVGVARTVDLKIISINHESPGNNVPLGSSKTININLMTKLFLNRVLTQ